eukprot:Seg1226.9 transcript_id=Seg1226.9/GoldUCD/mRNA.D3Y31 product="Betaine-homocysteine S-methyltransferase 1" protein_id=Seg1226.9/GoldUCD/D3Y31
MTTNKRCLIERLDAGEVIVGDGGMISNLERRGYVNSGVHTPEVVVEHPDAVRQLHREFIFSGADVLQPLTFRANNEQLRQYGINATCEEISTKACKIAKEVAAECDRPILVAGSLSETGLYKGPASRGAVQKAFESQIKTFLEQNVDFVVAEYFRYVEEICWAIETLKQSGKPVIASMCIGEFGDWESNVSTGDCAVKMAKAGADVIGLNCCFDPDQVIAGVKTMKVSLEKAGYQKHLISQPVAFWMTDADKSGYDGIPEYPLAMEPRKLTRFDMRKYAREAYNAGIRYIGGCCWFEAYHIREIAMELAPERGGLLPPNSDKTGDWGAQMKRNKFPWISQRSTREYWENLKPSTARPFSSAFSKSQYDPGFNDF